MNGKCRIISLCGWSRCTYGIKLVQPRRAKSKITAPGTTQKERKTKEQGGKY